MYEQKRKKAIRALYRSLVFSAVVIFIILNVMENWRRESENEFQVMLKIIPIASLLPRWEQYDSWVQSGTMGYVEYYKDRRNETYREIEQRYLDSGLKWEELTEELQEFLFKNKEK